MNVIELRNHLIERGLQSVRSEYDVGSSEYEGGIEGFELCRQYLTPEDFLNALTLRYKREHELRFADDVTKYWRYRHATIQIEFVWERMKIIYGIGDSFSARAYIDVAGIVGVTAPE